ncbi:MAG TPA: hypothetical protein EYP10_05840, partial [Armatimonadetes bacterium]|nr:hypothetical protein [Armatimonadota bacterium]
MEINMDVLRPYGGIYTAHLAQVALLRTGKPMRSAEIKDAIRSVVDISLFYLRQQLRHHSSFVFIKRRWELQWRSEAMHTPLEGTVSNIFLQWGQPVTVDELTKWIAPARDELPDRLAEPIAHILETRTQAFWRVDDMHYGSTAWLLDLSGGSEEDVIADNFFGEEERIVELLKRVDELRLNWEAPLSIICRELLDKLGQPLSHHEITLICWRGRHRELSPHEFLPQLFADARLLVVAPGYWCTPTLIERLRQVVLEESKMLDTAIAEASTDVDKMLKRAVVLSRRRKPPQPLQLTSDDWNELEQWLRSQGEPVHIERILTEMLELDPIDEQYVPTLHQVWEKLHQDKRLTCVGNHKWLPVDAIPEWVHTTPQALIPQPPLPPPEDLEASMSDL